MAIDPITGEVIVESGRLAKDSGYQVRQLQGEDVPLDASWRRRGKAQPRTESAADVIGDIDAREYREKERLLEARRKIAAILEEDEAPRAQRRPQQPQMVMRQKPSGGLSLDDLRDGLTKQDFEMAHADLSGLSQQERQALGMDSGFLRAPVILEDEEPEAMASWTATKAMAKLTSGQQIPVWMVADPGTGMELKKPFRVEAAAERACAILNQSGNVNDPRLRRLIEAHDQHLQLMKTIRATRKQIQEGAGDKKQVLGQLQASLEQVNLILGI